ncbi:MAG: TonB-dependent receptor [Bacteroidaceae bacterium]|nr:TonB-dependent receptor [Bacteroidaceae bacterium]
MRIHYYINVGIILMFSVHSAAQDTDFHPTDTVKMHSATVKARRPGTLQLRGAQNGTLITREELFKAACCNLGESFVTNPSVDVNYADATTGAQQIKLLGLSGTYVQMLTEAMPNFRGAALPYGLSYVPGSWMQSIQVSKGSASVKNGHESMTGQINIEYLKPDDTEGLLVNAYGNSKSRAEVNTVSNIHLNSKLCAEILGHAEKGFGHHDENHDTFLDQPRTTQWNLQNRWKFHQGNYLMHAGIALLGEERDGGQRVHATHLHDEPYLTFIRTHRYEAYMKHAVITNPEHGTNVALTTSASIHKQNAAYGKRFYHVNEKSLYAQLMMETQPSSEHQLSAGLSLIHDDLGQRYLLSPTSSNEPFRDHERETEAGAYGQYTLSLSTFTSMMGLRVDHSSLHQTFLTPRVHLKWNPTPIFTLRASAGEGRRTPHPLAEHQSLLSSGRSIDLQTVTTERAWNYGASATLSIPLHRQLLKLGAEYYYTRFRRQLVVDYDADPSSIILHPLHGKSYSHTVQAEASYPILKGLQLMAAYRWHDVRSTYGNQLLSRPLTSHSKGLLTASFKTPLGLWQADATLTLHGGGRMPQPRVDTGGSPLWSSRFHSFEQLSAQVTRWYRHFSVYVGGENLTGKTQKQLIIAADRPWSADFEPTMVWGPVHGATFYTGIRINLGKL